MKKTYIQPATEFTTVGMCSMIANSPSATLNLEDEVSASSIEVKQRNYSVWDEDWSAAE